MCYLVTKWHLAASMQGTGVSHTPSDPSHNTVFDYINMDMNILGICRTYIILHTTCNKTGQNIRRYPRVIMSVPIIFLILLIP